jgi:hypothetical protein
MTYTENLNLARTKRNKAMDNDIDLFNSACKKLFSFEKELVKTIHSFNKVSLDKSENKKIKCYPKYRKQRKIVKASVINRIAFEISDKSSESTIKTTLPRSTKWSRLIKQTTVPNKCTYKNNKRKKINKLFREYLNVSSTIESVAKYIESLGFSGKVIKLLPSVPQSENSHLSASRLSLANNRSYMFIRTMKLIGYYGDRIIEVEKELTQLVMNFNFSFNFSGMSFAYSWVIRDRKNPIRSIEKLTLWHICRPIDQRGIRTRFKKRITTLNRQYIRDCKLTRHSDKLLKVNKNIKKRKKEWDKLRLVSIRINQLLKTTIIQERNINA